MRFPQLDVSQWAAWWGASLATVVFAWDVYKWKSERPRIRVMAKKNDHEPADVDVFVANLGGKSITLRNISGCYRSKSKKIIVSASSFYANGPALPFILEPGGFWSCQLAFPNPPSEKDIAHGYVEVDVFRADKNKPHVHLVSIKKFREPTGPVIGKGFAKIGAFVIED